MTKNNVAFDKVEAVPFFERFRLRFRFLFLLYFVLPVGGTSDVSIYQPIRQLDNLSVCVKIFIFRYDLRFEAILYRSRNMSMSIIASY